MRLLSLLMVLLLSALAVRAQNDLQGNVIYVNADNYVVKVYGEYTSPVWEYWTKDDNTNHYYIYLDSIYEVQWPAPQTAAPTNDNTYYTYQGANISSSDINYKPVTYKKDVNSEIYVKDLKWNISYPLEYFQQRPEVPAVTVTPSYTITTSTLTGTTGTQFVSNNVSYVAQDIAYHNITALGYKNGTTAPFSWIQFKTYINKTDQKCRVECFIYGYTWKNPNAYLVVNYKVWYNNQPVSTYGTSYPYTVWANKGYFNSYGQSYEWTTSNVITAIPGSTVAPTSNAVLDPAYLYYVPTPTKNISASAGYDDKSQLYTIQYGHFDKNYYHDYTFGVYPVAPTTLPPASTTIAPTLTTIVPTLAPTVTAAPTVAYQAQNAAGTHVASFLALVCLLAFLL